MSIGGSFINSKIKQDAEYAVTRQGGNRNKENKIFHQTKQMVWHDREKNSAIKLT